MAGAGSRFSLKGYKEPKPLIRINDIPMIRLVIENLKPSSDYRFIFICQKAHIEQYGLKEKLLDWAPSSEIVMLDGMTEGAACTVLMARSFIDNESPLIIANCDQYIDADINDFLSVVLSKFYDGLIMTMSANDSKWSYVSSNNDGLVTKVVEKQIISNEATVGVYAFLKGSSFVKGALKMIQDNERTNNEFYVAPVYNFLIKEEKRIGVYNIGEVDDRMHGLGTPEDLEKFISLPIHKIATKNIK